VSVNGVDIFAPQPSVLIIPFAGVYKVLTTTQFDAVGGPTSVANMWIEQNGVPLPNSNSAITIANAEENVLAVEWFLTCADNDKIEICFASVAGNVFATAYPANPPAPETPSIITSVHRIA